MACRSLNEWLNQKTNYCKDCALSVLVGWYGDEVGRDSLKHLSKDDISPEKVVRELDNIKQKMPNKANRLKELDCMIQQASSEFLE